MLVQWTSDAWGEFFADGGQKQVRDAFLQCGMTNKLYGSEDNLIRVPGVDDYDIDGEIYADGWVRTNIDSGFGEMAFVATNKYMEIRQLRW